MMADTDPTCLTCGVGMLSTHTPGCSSRRPPNSLPNRYNMGWVAEQLGKYNDTDRAVVPNLSIVTVVGAYADGNLMTKDEWAALTEDNE